MFDLTDFNLPLVDGDVVLRALRQPVVVCGTPLAPPANPNQQRPIDLPLATAVSSGGSVSFITSAHASGDLLLTYEASGGALSYVLIADLEREAHEPAWIPPTPRPRRRRT